MMGASDVVYVEKSPYDWFWAPESQMCPFRYSAASSPPTRRSVFIWALKITETLFAESSGILGMLKSVFWCFSGCQTGGMSCRERERQRERERHTHTHTHTLGTEWPGFRSDASFRSSWESTYTSESHYHNMCFVQNVHVNMLHN